MSTETEEINDSEKCLDCGSIISENAECQVCKQIDQYYDIKEKIQ